MNDKTWHLKKIHSIAGICRHGISEIVSMHAIWFLNIINMKFATNNVNNEKRTLNSVACLKF